MTVGQLGESMTRRELNEWFVFTKIENEHKTMTNDKKPQSEKQIMQSMDSFANMQKARMKKHAKS